MTNFEKCANAIQTLLDTVDSLTQGQRYDLAERLDILVDKVNPDGPEVMWLWTDLFYQNEAYDHGKKVQAGAQRLLNLLDGTDKVTVDMDPDFVVKFRKDLEKLHDAELRICWGD